MMELAVLEKNPESAGPISPSLDEYLTYVAKSGNALFEWNKIKPLFKKKLQIVIQEFHDSSPSDDLPKQPNVDVFQFDQMKERIFEQLESYSGIPFTVQRLCELLVQPKRHYKRTDKFMRGLEKIMLVVSTIDPNPSSGEAESDPPELARSDTVPVHSDSESPGSQEDTTDTMESPSKRPRLSEEPGPCDSADEAVLNIQAGAGEDEAQSNSGGESAATTNGVEETNTAEAEAGVGSAPEPEEEKNRSGGEENMDIDTECTSSQARLTLTEPSPSQEETDNQDGVESSIGAGLDHNNLTNEDKMDIETGVSDGVSTSEVDIGQEAEAHKPVVVEEEEEDSGNLHSSSEESLVTAGEKDKPDLAENNSEADPVDGTEEEEEEEELAMIYPDPVPEENVQSSEERSESESAGLREDSGAADSSDEVTAASSTARSDITETVSCSDTTDTTSTDDTSDQTDNPSSQENTNNTSPDQSLQ